VWFLAISLGSVFLTAKTIVWTNGGELIFKSLRRELCLQPGELLWVHTAPLDWNRLLPFRVKSLNSSIFIWPRFSDMDSLWTAFRAHSPAADLDRISPW
jgi:hypothetical protein